MNRWAVFALEYEPVGGWRDIFGLYAKKVDAEKAIREFWKSADSWQLVDLANGYCIWEVSQYELNPCRSAEGKIEHDWTPWRDIVLRDEPGNDISFLFNPTVIKEPTKKRECRRCGEHNDNGKYRSSLPILSPIRNMMPRVSGSIGKMAELVETPEYLAAKIQLQVESE